MFDWSRLLRWFFSRERNQQGMSLADLEDMDVSVEYPLTIFDQEKFVVENGELVGTTGTINDDEITHTIGKPLGGYNSLSPRSIFSNTYSVDSDFVAKKASIIEASKATSLLFIQSKDSKNRLVWDFATAFFVAPNLLLTAGHAALGPQDAISTERWLSLPGTPVLDIDRITNHSPCAIRCTVVETTYKAGAAMSKDIAILSSGNFETEHFLKLSADPVPIKAEIDVVGYPGEKRKMWLKEKHPDLKSIVDGATASELLLPTGKLVVTRGVVAESRTDITSYNISTCPGLSGSCLVYNGKVHGISSAYHFSH